MFGSGNIRKIKFLMIFENFEIALVLLGYFQSF